MQCVNVYPYSVGVLGGERCIATYLSATIQTVRDFDLPSCHMVINIYLLHAV